MKQVRIASVFWLVLFFQVTGKEEIRDAARVLLHDGAGCVIARDGGNPILVLGEGLDQYVPVNKVNPVSTIGAGDCFDAAFLNAIASGEKMIAAVRCASEYTREQIQETLI